MLPSMVGVTLHCSPVKNPVPAMRPFVEYFDNLVLFITVSAAHGYYDSKLVGVRYRLV